MKWRDSSRAPKPREALDPYRFPGVRHFEDKDGGGTGDAGDRGDAGGTGDAGDTGDTRLPSSVPIPDPEERPLSRISAVHQRRLGLHAALTAAGIPPVAGDLHAIEAVSALDGPTNAAVRRWIACAR
ncbi:hypothetical protein [Streptomyces sp. NRRL S-244]|uniref:hypothetical protein n=1 Tax=Streptomyces sp. NRRL S-244 TaxID=1463897 RepID=UPI00068A9F25|nr:hypothetical protein [Streptomyces sp. NRRL S-244]